MRPSSIHRLNRYDHQRGVALITVLMVFSIAAILVSKLLLQRSIDAQRVTMMVNRTQASYYARVGEDLAILGLRAEETADSDANTPNIDTLEEEWTAAPYSFDIDSFSQISIRIVDLNRFYNLNNLLEPDGTINEQELTRFENLLFELGLDEELATSLADWLDLDDNSRDFGTESDAYLSKELAYRAANTYLFDARELAMIEGYSPEVLQVLLPHVTALEIDDILPVNINTASIDVLSTLLESTTGGDSKVTGRSGAQRILDERPYESLSDVSRSGVTLISLTPAPSVGGETPAISRSRSNADVRSQYFEINVRANYGGATAYLTSVVKQEEIGEKARYILLKRDEADNSARFVEQF